MNWNRYRDQFRRASRRQGRSDDFIRQCLEYASTLHERDLPIIFSHSHFSRLVGYRPQYIYAATRERNKFYRTFSIPKRSGGTRTISEPLPGLKEIQRWILDNILYKVEISRFAKAFARQQSIRDNARFHRRQKVVLTIDIEDFFGSIKAPRVIGVFRRCGYTSKVSFLLGSLCTLKGALPQGAPTSPALSNIVFLRADRRISAFSLANKIRYTRYADDMTFSGDFAPGEVTSLVRKVLAEEHLRINGKKTKVMRPHNRQEVTGIVTNGGLHAPRSVRRSLRQQVYYIRKYGVDAHILHTNETHANYLPHLIGIADFILFIDPNDDEVREYRRFLATL